MISRLSARMPWTKTPSTPGTLEEITVVSGLPVPVTLPMMYGGERENSTQVSGSSILPPGGT